MTTFIELTDVPADYANAKGKIVTVKQDESGLEYKASDDFRAELNLGERPDPDDLADDDVRAIEDDSLREKIYRVTEKIKAILLAHDDILYGANGIGGVLGPQGPQGESGATGPSGAGSACSGRRHGQPRRAQRTRASPARPAHSRSPDVVFAWWFSQFGW